MNSKLSRPEVISDLLLQRLTRLLAVASVPVQAEKQQNETGQPKANRRRSGKK